MPEALATIDLGVEAVDTDGWIMRFRPRAVHHMPAKGPYVSRRDPVPPRRA